MIRAIRISLAASTVLRPVTAMHLFAAAAVLTVGAAKAVAQDGAEYAPCPPMPDMRLMVRQMNAEVNARMNEAAQRLAQPATTGSWAITAVSNERGICIREVTYGHGGAPVVHLSGSGCAGPDSSAPAPHPSAWHTSKHTREAQPLSLEVASGRD